MLFYITDGQEHLVSFEQKTDVSYGNDVESVDWGDTTLHGLNSTNAAFQDIKSVGQTNGITGDGGYNVTFIPKVYIDTSKIAAWQQQEDHHLPKYNFFAHNCSDEVIETLHEG